jgi:pimeloyl-ACP methyl ester carboxylesterase
MPFATVQGIRLYYEEHGSGTPLVFVHEFAGDYRSWADQVRFFARRYRCVTYNARGYPPSDVPPAAAQYSQDRAAEDLLAILDTLKLERAHIVGFSMGGYATLVFGMRHPERARSLTLVGVGYGSTQDRSDFERDVELSAVRFEQEGMAKMGDVYARGPTRVQLQDQDPRGYAEFRSQLLDSSAQGHAHTLRGVQKKRPSVLQLEAGLKALRVPTLIVTGDEDEPCLEPGLFMKRQIASSALVVMPRAGHTVNLEAPDAFNRHVLEFLTQVDAGRWPLRNPGSLSKSAVLPADEVRR